MNIQSLMKFAFIALTGILIFHSPEVSKSQQIIPLTAGEIQPLFKQKTQNKIVLVNVWATWCSPCIEEFPDILSLSEKYADALEVIFISADSDSEMHRIKEFLGNQRIRFDTWLRKGEEDEFARQLHPEWNGALPFSMILAKGGKEIAFWENKADLNKFERFILLAIKSGEEK